MISRQKYIKKTLKLLVTITLSFLLNILSSKLIADTCDNLLKKTYLEIVILDYQKISLLQKGFIDLDIIINDQIYLKKNIDAHDYQDIDYGIFFKMSKTDLYKSFLKTFNYTDSYDSFNKYLLFLDRYKFSKENIEKEQKEELCKILEEHGTKKEYINTATPYKTIRKQSQDNAIFFLKKALKDFLVLKKVKNINPYNLLKISELLIFLSNKVTNNKNKNFLYKAYSFLEKVNFNYLHNAHLKPTKASSMLPLLSSAIISYLNIGRGINSYKTFTKTFLKSDNSVFFSIRPYFEMKNEPISSKYGANGYYLKHDYAIQKGIISIDLMFANESFMLFGKKYYQTKNEFSQSVIEKLDDKLFDKNIPNKELAVLNEIKNKLHILDFTPNDFEHLIKSIALIKLFYEIENKDSEIFFESMSKLKDNTYWFIREEIFMSFFGISDFELKIPAMVPSSELIQL